MKKYILGFILGGIVFGGGVVLAKEIEFSRYFVDTLKVYSPNGSITQKYYIDKTFDEHANVVCYSLFGIGSSQSPAISCLKNN